MHGALDEQFRAESEGMYAHNSSGARKMRLAGAKLGAAYYLDGIPFPPSRPKLYANNLESGCDALSQSYVVVPPQFDSVQ